MSKNNNQLKNLRKEMDYNSITLKKFLILYCGIKSESLGERKISHEEIKILFPYIKRTSFDVISKNKKCLYSGEIIVVTDSYGKMIPYVKPIIKEENTLEFNVDVYTQRIEESVIKENLSPYELKMLSKRFKQLGRFKEYRIIRNLLKKSKDLDAINYKTKKKKLIMKGREENDKY